jgi:N-acetylglutamate synthase-like GNAT family acetyltransferase
MAIFRNLKDKDERELLELFKQLTTHEIKFSAEACISDSTLRCLVVEENGRVVGFGALAIYRVPTKGLVGRVEDIVVDQKLRKRGFGRELVTRLLQLAKHNHVQSVSLTSSPHRVEARKLYESLGFKMKDTGVFERNL